jgi:hypothetical protein
MYTSVRHTNMKHHCKSYSRDSSSILSSCTTYGPIAHVWWWNNTSQKHRKLSHTRSAQYINMGEHDVLCLYSKSSVWKFESPLAFWINQTINHIVIFFFFLLILARQHNKIVVCFIHYPIFLSFKVDAVLSLSRFWRLC